MVRRENQQPSFMEAFMYLPQSESVLDKIDRCIDWKPLRRKIEKLYRKDGPGRPAFPVVTLFKVLLLQGWYDLSDPAAEETIADRFSFRRFLGLELNEKVPDHSTIHRFRDRIAPIADKLFAEFNRQLETKHLTLKKGTMVDASLIHSAAHPPAKDVESGDSDASWGGKQDNLIYGYKVHVGMDENSELIRQAELTTAKVHDSQVFKELVSGDEEAVYADKAYDSKERSDWLLSQGIRDLIMMRGRRGRPLSFMARLFNREVSRVRQGVERFFGTLKRIYKFRRCRYWTLSRNRCHIYVLCTCYNLKRAVKLGAA
jgi:IS5 family transposase